MKVSVMTPKRNSRSSSEGPEAGDEVILTRRGQQPCACPVKAVGTRKARRALLETIRAAGANKATSGPRAARSQDFLYGGNGFARLIAVDASALMAILLDEPQAAACMSALEARRRF